MAKRNSQKRGKQIASLEREIHNMRLARRAPKPKARGKKPPFIVAESTSGMRVRYNERWRGVTAAAVADPFDHVDLPAALRFTPGVSGLRRLDQLAQMYDCYRLHRAVVHYKPLVGTVINGEFLMAVDYDDVDLPADFSALQVLEPRSDGPVWKERVMPVNTSRAMKSKWHYTVNSPGLTPPARALQNAFCVAYGATGEGNSQPMGTIWVEYDIEFIGPQPASAQIQQNKATVNVATQITSHATNPTSVAPSIQTNGWVVRSQQQAQDLLPIVLGASYENALNLTGAQIVNPKAFDSQYTGDLRLYADSFSPVDGIDINQKAISLESGTETWLKKGQTYMMELAASMSDSAAAAVSTQWGSTLIEKMLAQGIQVLNSTLGTTVYSVISPSASNETVELLTFTPLKDIKRTDWLDFPILVNLLGTQGAAQVTDVVLNATVSAAAISALALLARNTGGRLSSSAPLAALT